MHRSVHGTLVGCFGGRARGIIVDLLDRSHALGGDTTNGDDGSLDFLKLALGLEQADQVCHHGTDLVGRRGIAEQMLQHHVPTDLVGIIRRADRCSQQLDAEDFAVALHPTLPGWDLEVTRPEHHRLVADFDVEGVCPFLVEHLKQILRLACHGFPQFRSCTKRLHHCHDSLVPTFSRDCFEERRQDVGPLVLQVFAPDGIDLGAVLRLARFCELAQLAEPDEHADQTLVVGFDHRQLLALVLEDHAGRVEVQGCPLTIVGEAGETRAGLHALRDLHQRTLRRHYLRRHLDVLKHLEAASQSSGTTIPVTAILAAALLVLVMKFTL